MAINQLSQSKIQTSSSIPFWAPNEGSDRRSSVSDLINLIQGSLTKSGQFITQYAAPSSNGFSILISPPTSGANVYLLMTPASQFQSGEIKLPDVSSCVDGQEVLAVSTQQITSLSVSGNGADLYGAPTSLLQNGFFRLRFDQVTKSWHRVG